MNLLMCPVCREALTLNERTWRCANSHSYDVAKQGYVNLHVVQHKHSKNPGDTPESVQARRAFLSAGHYAPLQQAVVNKVRELRIENLLDIGCGEGYYTDAMQAEVLQCVGVDIAKNAVQVAAKINKNIKMNKLILLPFTIIFIQILNFSAQSEEHKISYEISIKSETETNDNSIFINNL